MDMKDIVNDNLTTNALIKNIENGIQKKDKIYRFFRVTHSKSGDKNIILDRLGLIDQLISMGYRRLKIEGKYFYVKVEGNLVEEVSKVRIIDALDDEILSNGEWIKHVEGSEKTYDVRNKVLEKMDTFFSDNMMLRLRESQEIEFLEDTKDTAYFYYKNGLVEVTKNGIQLRSYDAIGDKKIWKNTMLNRDFNLIPESEFIESPFSRFCLLAGQNDNNLLEDRFNVLRQIMGYLMHRYFEGKMRAVILTDSRIDELGEANGRTGKTLIVQAIGKILNVNKEAKGYVEVNGKNFNPEKDRFKYQEARPDTKLIHLNDTKRGFDIEILFNDITEGVKVERKNKDPFVVKTKFVLSTNSVIKINGSSAKDRTLEFEMSEYFSSERSPQDVFKHWFFRDWNKKQWNHFDNFMIDCVRLYLINGMARPESINLEKKKQINETCREFVDFMDSRIDELTNSWIDKSILMNDFKNKYREHATYIENMKQRTFTSWIRSYAKYSDTIKTIPNSTENRKGYERESNGKYLVKLAKIE